MSKRESALQAGKLGCIKLKELAIEKYYKNPKICLYCGNVIMIRDGEKPSVTKRKKFCNGSCSASYSNAKREKKTISDEELARRKERDRVYSKNYRDKNKEKTLTRARNYRIKNKEKNRAYSKKHSAEIRISFIEMYGGKCECCGETQVEFLTLDHMNYSTKEKGETGTRAYMKAIKSYRPDLYQVSCYNCNCARRHGTCPHKK